MVEMAFPRRIYLNESVCDVLPTLMDYHGIKNILLITDPTISKLEFFRDLMSCIEASGANLTVYEGVRPEPSIEDVANAYDEIRGEYDAIVAVGGGSVIDFAKAMQIYLKQGGETELRDIAPFNPLRIEYRFPILVAVPTTCGTGSDASYGVVLTAHEGDKKVKLALGNYEVVPHISILDPAVIRKLPMNLKVGTAVDALSHAVESLVALDSNPFTRPYSEHSIRIIFRNLPKIRSNPEDIEALKNLHCAATMAGIAFTNAGLGLAHALAHQIGASLGIHHGTIVGMVLPYVVKLNYTSAVARRAYDDIMYQLKVLDGLDWGDTFYEYIFHLYELVGQPKSLKEYGVADKVDGGMVKLLAEMTVHDAEIVYNPVTPAMEDIEKVIESVVSGDVSLI